VYQYVRYETEPSIEIPWLSLCFEIYHFQSFRELVFLYLNQTVDDYKQTFINLDGKITLNQLYRTLPKPNSIIKDVMVALQMVNGTYKSPKINYNSYFFEPFYCIAFTTTGKTPTRLKHLGVDLSEQDANFYTIHLRRSLLNSHKYVFLHLHEHGSLLNQATSEIKTLPILGNITGCKFSFEISRYSFLPYPYTTDCFDYKNSFRFSQAASIERCSQRNLEKEFNRNLPFSSAQTYEETYLGYGFSLTLRDNMEQYFKYQHLLNICLFHYHRPDCEQTLFKMTNLEMFSGKSNSISISMNLIAYPTLRFETIESVELKETIIYVASILGIWFGFSITFDMPIAFVILHNFARKFTTNILIPKVKKLVSHTALSF